MEDLLESMACISPRGRDDFENEFSNVSYFYLIYPQIKI